MRSYSSTLLMCAFRRNSSEGSNLRCSWRMESILVLGAGMVALSAIQNPRIQIVSPKCILLRGEKIVCWDSSKALNRRDRGENPEHAEKTKAKSQPEGASDIAPFSYRDSLCHLGPPFSVMSAVKASKLDLKANWQIAVRRKQRY